MRIRPILTLLAFVGPASAATVVLKNGLEVSGVVAERDGSVEVVRDGKTRVFPRDRVQEIRKGESRVEEFSRRSAALEADDAAGWFKLGLWARENGVPGARTAFERVIAIEADHRAARRELGYESVDGVRVFFREAGPRAGTTILLFHGFPSSSHMFRDLIPRLASRYRVVAPDYPGFGHSDRPDPGALAYTFENVSVTIERCHRLER